MKKVFVWVPLVAVGWCTACAEEAPPGPQRVSVRPSRPLVEQPSSLIVNPHVRLRERSERDRQREADRLGLSAGSADDPSRNGGGGGGGGGAGADPVLPTPPPSPRMVEAYRRALESEAAELVSPEDDPCEQFGDLAQANLNAMARANGRRAPRQSREERRRLEDACSGLPLAMRRCLSPDYQRAHGEECGRVQRRMSRQMNRTVSQARERLAASRRATTGFAPIAADEDESDPYPDDELEE